MEHDEFNYEVSKLQGVFGFLTVTLVVTAILGTALGLMGYGIYLLQDMVYGIFGL